MDTKKNKKISEIVDENDVVVGLDTRENVHSKGLLHREIHVWFITPDGNMIFQHRAKDKDTYPDLLDATVGGHVEPGMTYEETAVKETEEETGLKISASDLHLIKKMRKRDVDSLTGKINNTIRYQYSYLFKGRLSDLKIETGKAVGFEAWPIDKILHLSKDEKKLFIPFYYSPEFIDFFNELKKLLN